ncbi:CBM9 family sugar-binding protein [Granulosicoccus antarcticus]|uniref:Carbohydrate-binding domain-containing protein n=1 Tax=Granulosicoccus antarcticus IMCC3135 TaxID=1192854 RepID=A0A2Z2NMU2_9GAMM|nr:CBM9 family sugar-binding protein [Granulosicoccus antarcticus]ASJ71048.1 hypothetical protein IMCC3135_04675 [Granulosicoccus antarcticus IMCC3135]
MNKEGSAPGLKIAISNTTAVMPSLFAAAGAGRRVMRLAACLAVPVVLLGACNTGSSDGEGGLNLNESSGLTLSKPGFLISRAIDESLVEARVSVDVDGINYPATQLSASTNGSAWKGELFVPEGSDANLMVNWVETGVEGLPAELNSELLLASYERLIPAVSENQSITLDADAYVVASTEENPRPDLDIDADGFGNLQERLEGTDPNDLAEGPPEVVIFYTDQTPVIDGSFDPLWNNAQYFDTNSSDLLINNVLIDNDVIQPGEPDRSYRWAGMHDGQFLYLMVFSELDGAQTPFGDSFELFNDDAIDIFLDGNNSKGASYDGIDDYHAIISLLSTLGEDSANSSDSPNTRFDLGGQSAPIDVSAFEFATCICQSTGEQQIYEVSIDLQRAGITVGESFGLDIQLNNDVDGGMRDAKWAWHNDTGEDNTWRFPIRMGTARLEPEPL